MASTSFGENLRTFRSAQRLTARRLAKMAGISPPYLSQLESNRATPSEPLARRFAKILGQEEERVLFSARRVSAQLGSVLEKYPKLAVGYFGAGTVRPVLKQDTEEGGVPPVRVIDANQKGPTLVNYSAASVVSRSTQESTPTPQGGMCLPDTFDAISPSIVAFATRAAKLVPGGPPAFPTIIGTGFVVDSNGIVVTNKHVVDALQSLPRNPATGASSDVAIVWSSIERSEKGHFQPILFVDIKGYSSIESFSAPGPFYGEKLPDLAFVQLNVRGLPAVALSAEPNTLRAGMTVATAGFPLGTASLVGYGHLSQITPFLRQGIVSSLYPFSCPNPHGFTVDIMTQGGASGSPVFLSDTPKVVGMIHAGFQGTNVTIAIPALLIEQALKVCNNGELLDLKGVPTLRALIDQSERSSDLKWQSFVVTEPPGT